MASSRMRKLNHIVAAAVVWALTGCAASLDGSTPDDASARFATLSAAKVFAEGKPASSSDLLAAAAQSRTVCIGEEHDTASHHELQHELLQFLATADNGMRLALGMEMFRRPMQPSLDAYFRSEINATELRRLTKWEKTWGFDFAMYEPLLETARREGVRVIGLNAHRSLTRAVARHGLASLPQPVRNSLPALVLDDAEHRRFFWTIMGFGDAQGAHGHGHGMSPENFYTAQVIWDETMAESASAWLSDPEKRQIVVIAGNGHCHQSAIPRRVARRHKSRSLSILVRSRGKDLPAHARADYVVEVE